MNLSDSDFNEALAALSFKPSPGGSTSFIQVGQDEASSLEKQHKRYPNRIVSNGKLNLHELHTYLNSANPSKKSSSATAMSSIILLVDEGRYFNEIALGWDDFNAILKSFKFPTRFAQVLAFGLPVSKTICSRINIDATHQLLVSFHTNILFALHKNNVIDSRIHLSFGPNVDPSWVACSTWNTKTRETNALVRVSARDPGWHIEELEVYILEAMGKATAACHPLYTTMPFWELAVSSISTKEIKLSIALDRLEERTGPSPFASDDLTITGVGADLTTLLKDLNTSFANTAAYQKKAQILRNSLESLREGVSRLSMLRPETEPDGDHVHGHIDVLLGVVGQKILYLQGLEKRCQVQLSYVYNALALRDSRLNMQVARDSKQIALSTGRDSIAMKTVAVLTMCFLPATFVAALFAMPMLNWQAVRITDVAGSRFGLYWAVTVPLTVAVLISWFVWTSVMMRKQADESKAARNTL